MLTSIAFSNTHDGGLVRHAAEGRVFAVVCAAVAVTATACTSPENRAVAEAEAEIERTVERINGSMMSVEGAEIVRQERRREREPIDRLAYLRGAAEGKGAQILTEDDEGFVASIRHRSRHQPTWDEPFELDLTRCYRFDIGGLPRPEAHEVTCPAEPDA